jgi:hypothetical protein
MAGKMRYCRYLAHVAATCVAWLTRYSGYESSHNGRLVFVDGAAVAVAVAV